jgi:c-di-GMP-binding flagellar brake protein YcgR
MCYFKRMKNSEEKRAYPRVRVYHLVKYRLLSRPDAPMVLASFKNIGGGGACLRTPEALSTSDIIQLYINMPGFSQAFPSVAKVVWVKKAGKNQLEAGLHFMEIEELIRNDIIKRIDFVNRRLEEKQKEDG